MATYMLIWNPNNFTIKQCIEQLLEYKDNNNQNLRWSCYNSNAKAGDRVFLMVVGNNKGKIKYNLGICSSGIIVKSYYKDKHWNGTDTQCGYIVFQLERFFNPEIHMLLTKEVILDKVGDFNNYWRFQSTGVRLPEIIADGLFREWNMFINGKEGGYKVEPSIKTIQTELDIKNGEDIVNKAKPTVNKNPIETDIKQVAEEDEETSKDAAKERELHTLAQYYLSKIGEYVGCENHIARNDRNRVVLDTKLGDFSIDEIPHRGVTPETYKIISLIDNVWVKKNSPICAFEIETSTSIYSGLLRMSDLICTYSSMNIQLYIVAPEKRKEAVRKEVLRPTFQEIDMEKHCSFISIEELSKLFVQTQSYSKGLTIDYIENIAIKFTEE